MNPNDVIKPWNISWELQTYNKTDVYFIRFRNTCEFGHYICNCATSRPRACIKIFTFSFPFAPWLDTDSKILSLRTYQSPRSDCGEHWSWWSFNISKLQNIPHFRDQNTLVIRSTRNSHTRQKLPHIGIIHRNRLRDRRSWWSHNRRNNMGWRE
jgi:hypothetical protein